MFDTPEWREKEARATAERAANAEAQARGEPMPFPNPWDAWDPTKVPADATPEQITERYREFAKRCRVRTKRCVI